MNLSRRGSITASVSSSVTLTASDVALDPTSPTAENFYTPLQTPAAPPVDFQEQLTKSKKKKSKKKKKKPVTEEATEAPATPSVTTSGLANSNTPLSSSSDDSLAFGSDPFGAQMSHIDAIRNTVNDPASYYSMVNRETAERAEQETLAQAAASAVCTTMSTHAMTVC